jgi:hypothetical protein
MDEITQKLQEKLKDKTNLPIELSEPFYDSQTFQPFVWVSANETPLGKYPLELLSDLQYAKSLGYMQMTGSANVPDFDVIEEAAEIIIQGLNLHNKMYHSENKQI